MAEKLEANTENLKYALLTHSVSLRITPHHTTTHHNTTHHNTPHHNTPQHTTTQHNTRQIPDTPHRCPHAPLELNVSFRRWGPGKYKGITSSDDVEMQLNGETHRLSVEDIIGCYQFNAFRVRDQKRSRGWVMMKHVSMEYTGWRDAWGCKGI